MGEVAFPALLQHMDQVDAALIQGALEEPAASVRPGPLDPVTEAALPVLLTLYREQEGRTLPTAWLRQVLARPSRAGAASLEKLQREAADASRRIRQANGLANGSLLVSMVTLVATYGRLSFLQSTAAHAPDSAEGQAALASLMTLANHMNIIGPCALGFMGLIFGSLIAGGQIQRQATERLHACEQEQRSLMLADPSLVKAPMPGP